MSKIIHVCPEHTPYRFHGKCAIETCQHHNKVTQSGCLALDRAEGDRGCTVTEVAYYKAYALQRVSGGPASAPLTLKGVETAQRRNNMQVREAIRFYLYICFLDERGVRSDFELCDGPEELQILYEDLLAVFYELRPYMIPFVFNEKMIAKFAQSQRKGFSPEPFNFKTLLGKKSRVLTPQLKELTTSCLNLIPNSTPST